MHNNAFKTGKWAEMGTDLFNASKNKSVPVFPVNFQPKAHANIESKASWHEPYEGIPAFQGIPEGALE